MTWGNTLLTACFHHKKDSWGSWDLAAEESEASALRGRACQVLDSAAVGINQSSDSFNSPISVFQFWRANFVFFLSFMSKHSINF